MPVIFPGVFFSLTGHKVSYTEQKTSILEQIEWDAVGIFTGQMPASSINPVRQSGLIPSINSSRMGAVLTPSLVEQLITRTLLTISLLISLVGFCFSFYHLDHM